MPPALFALALGGFGIGLTEFVIMGLLPEVAASFRISLPIAAHLISGYALGVVGGALLLTPLTTALRRKPVLLGLMLLFIAGNLISALSPSYAWMMVGRIVASLCHGAFFGIGSVLAADLVPQGKGARAVATMFAGLTTANVLGVPLGTLVGQQFGWRTTFLVIAGVGLLTLVELLGWLPDRPRQTNVPLGQELRAFRKAQVWLSLAMTALGFGAVFASFTYVAPLMTVVAGFPDHALSWLLVLFGAGLFIGNLVGGKLADQALDRSLILLLGLLTLVLLAFAWTAPFRGLAALMLFVLGIVGFATVPGFQMRVMTSAGEAPTLASAANIAAFNLGNALGAYLAGLGITRGLGFTSANLVGAGLAGLALVVALIAQRGQRRSTIKRLSMTGGDP